MVHAPGRMGRDSLRMDQAQNTVQFRSYNLFVSETLHHLAWTTTECRIMTSRRVKLHPMCTHLYSCLWQVFWRSYRLNLVMRREVGEVRDGAEFLGMGEE